MKPTDAAKSRGRQAAMKKIRCITGFVVGGENPTAHLVFPLTVDGRTRDQMRSGLEAGAIVYLDAPIERIRSFMMEGDTLLIEEKDVSREDVSEEIGVLCRSRIFVEKQTGIDKDGDVWEKYRIWRVVEEGEPPLVECVCRTDWDGRWVALAMVALQRDDLAIAKAAVSFASDRSREKVQEAIEPLRKELEAARRRAEEAEDLVFEIIASRLSPPEVEVLQGEGYRFSQYLKRRA